MQLELSKLQSTKQNEYNTNRILANEHKNELKWLCVHHSSMMCISINLIFIQFAISIDSWNLSGPELVHINAIFSFLLYIKLFSIFNIFFKELLCNSTCRLCLQGTTLAVFICHICFQLKNRMNNKNQVDAVSELFTCEWNVWDPFF